MSARLWKGGVKATRLPGERGYWYANQRQAGSYSEASDWARRVVRGAEDDGRSIVQVFLTPEDER